MARVIEISDEVISSIRDHILKGAPVHMAAGASGVSRSTHYRWMAEGEIEGEGPKWEYWDSVTRARDEYAVNTMKELHDSFDKEGNAVGGDRKWALERNFPSEFGKSVELKVRGDVIREVINWLREELDPGTFAQVAAVLDCEDS